jgi:AcrR family transcriptional regulator
MSAPHPTRQALLDAGVRLAEASSLANLSVNAIVGKADVAKGTFYVHFADRKAYLVALHRGFHDDLLAQIRVAIEPLPPGNERIRAGVSAYLDGCLKARAVKALLLESRAEPEITNEVQKRNRAFSRLLASEFEAADAVEAAGAARLLVATIAELALAEAEKGNPDQALRRHLWRMLAAR